MAVRLLAALIALGLVHLLPQLARWHAYGLFRRWVAALRDLHGVPRVIVVLAVPVAFCLLLAVLLHHSMLADLALLLFDTLVLLFCFGPRALEADLEGVLHATDAPSREAAAQKLDDSGDRVECTAHALGAAISFAALRRRFGALLWFFLLGPAGALLYRLGQTLGRDGDMPLDDTSRRAASRFANTLDWIPAQLLVFTLAVVGHWDAVIGAWKRWHQQWGASHGYQEGPGFLAAAAFADIAVEIDAGDGYAEERIDPMLELVRMRSALLRALVAWLSVIALIVLGGWVH